jgi:hypothetical protein
MKPMFTYQSRDFYDKGISFFHDGKFYMYQCYIEEKDEAYKKSLPDKNTTRG